MGEKDECNLQSWQCHYLRLEDEMDAFFSEESNSHISPSLLSFYYISTNCNTDAAVLYLAVTMKVKMMTQ